MKILVTNVLTLLISTVKLINVLNVIKICVLNVLLKTFVLNVLVILTNYIMKTNWSVLMNAPKDIHLVIKESVNKINKLMELQLFTSHMLYF